MSDYVGKINPAVAPYRTELAYDQNPVSPVPTLQIPNDPPERQFVADPYSEASQQRLSRAVEFLSIPFVDGGWKMDSALVAQRLDNSIATRQAYQGGSYSTPALQYPWYGCAEANCCSVTPSSDCSDTFSLRPTECKCDTCRICPSSPLEPYCPAADHIGNGAGFSQPRLRQMFMNPCLSRLQGALKTVRHPHTVRTANNDNRTEYVKRARLPQRMEAPPQQKKVRRAKKDSSLPQKLMHGIKNTGLGIAYDLQHWASIPDAVVHKEGAKNRLEFVLCRDNRPIYLVAILVGLVVMGLCAFSAKHCFTTKTPPSSFVPQQRYKLLKTS